MSASLSMPADIQIDERPIRRVRSLPSYFKEPSLASYLEEPTKWLSGDLVTSPEESMPPSIDGDESLISGPDTVEIEPTAARRGYRVTNLEHENFSRTDWTQCHHWAIDIDFMRYAFGGPRTARRIRRNASRNTFTSDYGRFIQQPAMSPGYPDDMRSEHGEQGGGHWSPWACLGCLIA